MAFRGSNWGAYNYSSGYIAGDERTFGSLPAYTTDSPTDFDSAQAVQFNATLIASLDTQGDTVDGGEGNDIIVGGNGDIAGDERSWWNTTNRSCRKRFAQQRGRQGCRGAGLGLKVQALQADNLNVTKKNYSFNSCLRNIYKRYSPKAQLKITAGVVKESK